MSSEDFKSFIVTNPDLVDEGIDVSGLRTTTDASILGNIPDYGGIQYEAYNPNRLSDLMTLYSTGLPTIPTETAQIPAAVDTLVDTGGGGGMDQATGGLDLGDTTITGGTNLNDYEGMGDMTGGITGDPIEMENLSPIDIGTVDDYDDLNDYENAVAAANISGTISGAPDVFDINETGDPALNPGSINVGDQPNPNSISTIVNPEIFDPYGASVNDPQIGDPGFENYTPSFEPEQQGIIDQAFSKVGSTAENIMNDLSQIPGAVVDFANQTVDIFGKKINVGKTLLSAGINKIVGGPISLVFDAVKAVAGMLPDGIEATTSKAREIGLIQGDNTVTQDIYGINTQSMFGDYNQYNIDRVEQLEDKINKTPRDITELQQRKDYIDSSGALGDIDDDPTGDAQIAEQIEADNRAAEADRIEAERRALQEINARAEREAADAQAAANAAAQAAEIEAQRRALQNINAGGGGGGGNNGGGGQNTGGARGGGTSATSSGLGGLGFSDIRLKDNVELIGKSPSNINIYKFNYKGNPTIYQGAMAHEVSWASVKANNGYLMIDYNKIDVEFKPYAK